MAGKTKIQFELDQQHARLLAELKQQFPNLSENDLFQFLLETGLETARSRTQDHEEA